MNVFEAAKRGNLEQLRALVEHDARLVHATDEALEWTALLWAAFNGRVEAARYLLDHGAAVNHRDQFQNQVLHWACCRNDTGVVALLLQNGADVTVENAERKTPLMFAATHGGAALFRLFLEHGGSDVDAADVHGRTACHRACNRGHSGLLRQLLEAGADPTLRDMQGITAGHLAAAGHQQECVTILEEWNRAYTLNRIRSIREASSITAKSKPPVDAASA